MATFTRHPVQAPPHAPARESTRRLLLRGHGIFVAFSIFAAPAWDLALGTMPAGILLVAMTLGTLGWWIPRIVAQAREGGFPWRRLPWAALGYLLWAGASLIWSAWPAATLLTWSGMLLVTVNALFLASTLSWHELVRVLASALKWVVGLSFLFELVVTVIIQHPIFPLWRAVPTGKVDPQLYWSRDNLLDGGRIQGIVGNANLLAMLCLIALIVFAVRFASRAPRRGLLVVWFLLAAFLFARAASATAWMCLLAALLVLGAILIMRRARRPTERTVAYALFTATGAVIVIVALTMRDQVFALLGKSADLTGRGSIWAAVWERAAQRPVIGWGFSSPWVPFEKGFDGWIVDHGQTVMQAHDLWLDILFQVGIVGLLLIIVVFAAFTWRAWFFAIDRPRWDIDARRPFAVSSVLPSLIAAVLLVQSLTESNPGMIWGWMLVVALSFKIKTAPIVSRGEAEHSIERGTETNAR